MSHGKDPQGSADNAKFTREFVVVNSEDKAPAGPWEFEQPLKPRPKEFAVHDPDLEGG